MNHTNQHHYINIFFMNIWEKFKSFFKAGSQTSDIVPDDGTNLKKVLRNSVYIISLFSIVLLAVITF